jgi:hypothetical protein
VRDPSGVRHKLPGDIGQSPADRTSGGRNLPAPATPV